MVDGGGSLGGSVVLSLDRTSFFGDVKMLLMLAAPNAAASLVAFLVSFSSVVFVGRLGAEYMGAATLATMMSNLFGFSIGYGATSALDALCSQAYGAKSYLLVGRHTQRAMVLLTMACFPVAIIWLNAGTVLSWMGIEDRICELASHYVSVLILGMWPNFMFECLRRYLQSQSLLWPIFVSAISTAVIATLLNVLFMVVWNLGFTGPALATALSQWVMFFSVCTCIIARRWWRRTRRTTAYAPVDMSSPRPELSAEPPESSSSEWPSRDSSASPAASEASSVELTTMTHRLPMPLRASDTEEDTMPSPVVAVNETLPAGAPSTLDADVDPEETWPSPWSMEVFSNWGELLKLALPGALSLFIEWGSYEVSASAAARLGATNLAIQSVFMQTSSLLYMVPSGLATATSICVGQFLGARRGDRAHEIARLGMVMSVIHPLIAGLFLLACRSVWGRIFSSDEVIVDGSSHFMPILCIYIIADHTKCICMAILRGCGRAPITVYGNTLACWCVGFPAGYLLVFQADLGLWGLWTSTSMAWGTAALLYSIIITRTDWSAEVEQARLRTERSQTTAAAEAAASGEGEIDLTPALQLKPSRSPPPTPYHGKEESTNTHMHADLHPRHTAHEASAHTSDHV